MGIHEPNEAATLEALRASEIRYRRLFESAKDGILILDAETGVVDDVNPFLVELLGLSRETFLHKKIWELGFFKDIAANEGKFYELRRMGYVRYEDLPLKSFDGRKIDIEFVSNVYMVKNKLVIQCNIRDITDRKQAEGAREEALNRIQKIAGRVPGVVYQYRLRPDGSSCMPFASEAINKIFRVSPDEVREDAARIFANIHPDDNASVVASIQKSAQDLSHWKHEFRMKFSDGAIFSLYANAVPQREDDGSVLWHGFITDITERKRAEEELRTKEKQLFEITSRLPVIVFQFNARSDGSREVSFVIGQVKKLLGFDPEPQRFLEQFTDAILPEQREDFLKQIERTVHDATEWKYEGELRKPSGEIVWIAGIASPTKQSGEILYDGIIFDITERKRAEEMLRKSEERFRAIYERAPIGIALMDSASGRFLKVNPMYCEIVGYSQRDMLTLDFRSITHPEDLQRDLDEMSCLGRGESNYYKIEKRYIRKNGTTAWVQLHVVPLTWKDGILTEYLAIVSDINARKRAEEALRESLERAEWLAKFPDENTSPVLRIAADGTVLYRNPAAARLSSWACELGQYPPDPILAFVNDVWKRGKWTEANIELDKKFYLVSAMPFDKEGYANIYGRDITEQRHSEEALRQSDERFRIALDATKDGVWEWDLQTNQSYHSPRWFEILGYSYGDPELPNVFQSWDSRIHPDDYDRVTRSVNNSIEKGVAFDLEYRHRHKSGEYRWQSSRGHTICDKSGKAIKIIGCISDITGRKCAEEELRKKERLLSESQRLGHIGSWLMSMTGPSSWSEEFYRLLGMAPDEFPPTFELLFSVIHPDDLHLMQAWLDASTAGKNPEELDFRIILPDSTIRFIRGRGESVFDANNKLTHMAGTAQDVTRYKLAEEEHLKLTTQLQQAQKMESVGRLAGGVAHDFNNMLGVILGYSELALQGVDPKNPLHGSLMEIHTAAIRSADLTRQLLAFARKQTVAPRVLDLNQTVISMFNMLQRLIGENLNLKWNPLENLWQIKVDPGQIDQILANLCVNARDAIKGGGTITIETGNSTLDENYCAAHIGSIPGEYVTLTVSDDGCGMDKETLAQIFEPFFTTKDIGKGTGLGLSTVYGIVKQNNGFINAYSESGHGTTFTIYLPRHEGKAGQAAGTVGSAELLMSGHETVLLVEDNPSILKLTAKMLEKQGYAVLAASTPREALRLADEYGDQIHLLMTDVVMPEMNGRDLAKNLMGLYPNLKLLFMSGYTADVIAHNGVLDEGVHFIQKPFSTQSLATKLREVLDSM